MNQVSAYELAMRMSQETATDQHRLKGFKQIDPLTRGEQVSAEDPYAAGIAAAFETARSAGGDDEFIELLRASGFLYAAAEKLGAGRLPEAEVCAYQVLSLSRMISATNPDVIDDELRDDRLSEIPGRLQEEVAAGIYDGRFVSDEEIAVLMPSAAGAASLVTSETDRLAAASLLAAVRNGDERTGEDAELVEAVKVIGGTDPSEDVERALSRVYASVRLSGEPMSASAAAMQLGADLVLQKQAQAVLGTGGGEAMDSVRQAAKRRGEVAREVTAQAAGDFEQISRGGRFEIAKDINHGDILPESRKIAIDHEVSQLGISLTAARAAQTMADQGVSVG